MTAEQQPVQKTAAELAQAKKDAAGLQSFHRTLETIIRNAPKLHLDTDEKGTNVAFQASVNWLPLDAHVRHFFGVDAEKHPNTYMKAQLYHDGEGNHMTLALMDGLYESTQIRHITITTRMNHGRGELDIESSLLINPAVIGDGYASPVRTEAYAGLTWLKEVAHGPTEGKLGFARDMADFVEKQIGSFISEKIEAQINKTA